MGPIFKIVSLCFAFMIALSYSVNAAIIMNCEAEKRVYVAGCGYAYICKDEKTQEPLYETFVHEQTSGWTYKLFADDKKLLLIRDDGHEIEWVHNPENSVYVFRKPDVNIEARDTSKRFAVWLKNNPTNGAGKFFYTYAFNASLFVDVGRCQ